MCAAKLKEALNDCLINFDCRVLLTDLINQYHMPIEEVSRTLNDYLSQQEKEGVKYAKRYVVHGTEAGEPSKEVFQIVSGESKLNDWLKKLNSAESSLYSVEVEGGAKPPAEDLKPVTWCANKLENLEIRKKGTKNLNSNAGKSADVKVETKTETKPAKGIAGAFGKTKPRDTTNDATTAKDKGKEVAETTTKAPSADKKKTSPQNSKKTTEGDVERKSPKKSAEQKKHSPKDKKAAASSGQKGIGNFFTTKNKEAADSANKVAIGTIRQRSPQKLNDYFKKKDDKNAAPKEALKQQVEKANTSTQLFTEDASDEEKEAIPSKKNLENNDMKVEVVADSSDEEEELNKLRRKVEDADKEESTNSRKRLRIEDSDDEDVEDDEEPQKKQEKLDDTVLEKVEDSAPKSETYLDEEGFVITVKSKKPRPTPATPAISRKKTPTKKSPKDKKAKQTPTPAAKSKQGNIMNFFKKK